MHHAEQILASLALILVLGIAAQWIAWRFKLPSILLLLTFGFLAGPVFGVLKPNELFGELLNPIVSLSVAIILFEGGLSLRIADIVGKSAKVVRNLVSIGALLTWWIAAAAAYFLLDFSLQISLLVGAILIVTGPTVIGPILRTVRPVGSVGTVLRWEGIVIDPIGVVVAVLMFEIILAQTIEAAIMAVVWGVLKTVFFGGLIGLLSAYIMTVLFRRYAIPDYLRNPFALMLVIFAHATSNIIQPEAGLLAVTVMGVTLANQKTISVGPLLEFKEDLQVIIISVLFIILSARLDISVEMVTDIRVWLFILALFLIARPASVLASTYGSGMGKRERLFLMVMAPRGIVAAAMVSLFSLELEKRGIPGGTELMAVTFMAIVATVAVYGLSSFPAAKALKLADANPQGVLFVGATDFAVSLAVKIQQLGLRVNMVDSNSRNVRAAQKAGVRASPGSVFSAETRENLDLSGIGRLFALTQNDQANSLASVYFSREFGRAEVYQSYPAKEAEEMRQGHEFRGRFLFGPDYPVAVLNREIGGKLKVENIPINLEDIEETRDRIAEGKLIPLAFFSPEKKLMPFTASRKPELMEGGTLVAVAEYSFIQRVGKKLEQVGVADSKVADGDKKTAKKKTD